MMAEPVTTTLDMLRHGECEGGNIFRGSLDVALSAEGWKQMHTATRSIPGWQRIVSSPLQRCHRFAQALATERQLPLTVDDRLRELHFGAWEGRSIAEVWAQQFETASAWLADPGANPPPEGETLHALGQRTGAARDALLQQAHGEHVLIVAHGGVIRALLGQALNMPMAVFNRLDIPYACLSRLTFTHTDEGVHVRLRGHNLAAPCATPSTTTSATP